MGVSVTPRVLVVDDDESIRTVTTLALELVAGWQVVAVDGGEAALEVAQGGGIDAVLLDLMMPGMDGLTTFRRLQDDDRTRDLPVVLITAKVQAGPTQVWDGLGVRGVIAKPFSTSTLAAEVADLLGWERPEPTP